MRPIELKICAIGPFAGEMPPIRFERFRDKGIFLITGDTGAGKTTIFDALCFALFGETSGSYRDTKQLRSDYADDRTESFVEFTFSHQGRQFRVWRRPSYIRKKLRGSGTTEQPECAVLEELGQTPIEGLQQVSRAVEELLGINARQFKQIAMIAQGEFRDLLNASTQERTRILRSIFVTDGYDRIGDRLKERMDRSRKEKEERTRSILQHFRDVRAGETSFYEHTAGDGQGRNPAEELTELRKEGERTGSAWNLDQMLLLLDRLDALDREVLKGQEMELRELLGRLELEKTVLEKSRYNRKLEEELAADRRELAGAVKAAEAADEEVRRCRTLDGRLEELRGLLLTLKEEEPKYRQREEQRSELRKIRESAGRGEIRLENAAQEEIKLEAAVETLREAIRKRREVPAEQIRLEAEKKLVEARLAEAGQLLRLRAAELEEREGRLRRCQAAYSKSRTVYDAAERERGEAERRLECARAGILARELEEGRPCPVCGSLHHPEPAALPENAVTEAECKAVREVAERCRKEKDEHLRRAGEAAAGLVEVAERLTEDIRRLLESSGAPGEASADTADAYRGEIKTGAEDDALRIARERAAEALKRLSSSEAVWRGQAERLSAQLAEARREAEALKKDEQALAEAEEALPKRRKEKAELERSLQELRLREAEVRTSLAALSALRHEDWRDAQAEAAALVREGEEITKRQQDAQLRQKQAGEAAAGLSARIESKQKQLEAGRAEETQAKEQLRGICGGEARGTEALSGEERERQVRALEEQCGLQQKLCHAQEARISLNHEKKKLMEEQKEGLRASEREYAVSLKLYNLVRGLAKNGKITLEQYIQAAGFDSIIEAANRRLRPMSGGQYELVRTAVIGRKTDTFLDLEVQDYYSGTRRAVGNLSGGESFKASLSLALGLSDTVSRRHGGIQIDALFVDEGFGTLDKRSIDSAMEILLTLSEADRLVGIISHREELAENITDQIRVVRTRTGSELQIVTD